MPANLQIDARWDAIRDAREAAKKSDGKNAPSPSVMVAWAVVRAMEKHAAFRSVMLEDDRILENENFDLGVAVAMEGDRLATAVIPEANSSPGRTSSDATTRRSRPRAADGSTR